VPTEKDGLRRSVRRSGGWVMMGTPGHSYDIDVVIDDTIATIYVDGSR
jgi:hypothetical protein